MSIPNADRGRRQLVWGVGCGTLLLLGIELDVYLRTGVFSAIGIIGRPFIFAALGALAFEGRAWAPKVAGVWIGLLAVVAAVNAVPALKSRSVAAIVLFAFALLYLLIAYQLIASAHIRAFVASRSARRSAETPAP